MTRAVRILLSILLVLLLVPGWTGEERVPLLDRDTTLVAQPYVPAGGWPRRIGALEPIGALALSSPAPAFGGFSALSLAGGRTTMLSDSGNLVQFAIRRGKLVDARAGYLPAGPYTGWQKSDRDSESLAVDAATGSAWVGFERANAIWRYAPGFARVARHRAPWAMRKWRDNTGAESLARLPDGRFIAIAEGARGPARPALIFSGDPAAPRTRMSRFKFRPPPGFSPSDAAALPDGRVLVLTRRFRPPLRFTTKIVLLPAAQLSAGATAEGRVIATLAAPYVSENCEGIAITRERGATMVWLVNDNDGMFFRPTLLMKFRLH